PSLTPRLPTATNAVFYRPNASAALASAVPTRYLPLPFPCSCSRILASFSSLPAPMSLRECF
ncbi:hypothetical protein SK128_022492, partial [Halocaridina rubra]